MKNSTWNKTSFLSIALAAIISTAGCGQQQLNLATDDSEVTVGEAFDEEATSLEGTRDQQFRRSLRSLVDSGVLRAKDARRMSNTLESAAQGLTDVYYYNALADDNSSPVAVVALAATIDANNAAGSATAAEMLIDSTRRASNAARTAGSLRVAKLSALVTATEYAVTGNAALGLDTSAIAATGVDAVDAYRSLVAERIADAALPQAKRVQQNLDTLVADGQLRDSEAALFASLTGDDAPKVAAVVAQIHNDIDSSDLAIAIADGIAEADSGAYANAGPSNPVLDVMDDMVAGAIAGSIIGGLIGGPAGASVGAAVGAIAAAIGALFGGGGGDGGDDPDGEGDGDGDGGTRD